MQLAASPDVVDHYAESVATPALEAFEVDIAAVSDSEIELATVTVDDRAVAYASGGSGATTVVFESGHGDGMATWEGVAPDVAEFAPIFVYDRPGYGRSDLTDTPAMAPPWWPSFVSSSLPQVTSRPMFSSGIPSAAP